ncbi:MAG: hypothetical protein HKM07_03795 [Chlamydiae bacterium]|nr:hypothetical protein [Chlamydiota bacterium]
MINPIQLEEAYKNFVEDLHKWVPDGIIPVNMALLNDIGLLTNEELENHASDNITQSFNVIETSDKVTLFNEQFAIWIVPKSIEHLPMTLTLISWINNNKLHLEIAFSTSGVYNTPKFILKVLQHFLKEVIDTEAIISSIDKKS